MKDDILINDILKALDDAILDFDVYMFFNNLNKENKEK
jgi:hypothetical protein